MEMQSRLTIMKNKSVWSWENVLYCGCGFLLGGLQYNSLALGLCLGLYTMVYYPKRNLFFPLAVFYLLASLMQSFWKFYFNLILFCVFLLLVAFAKLLDVNLMEFFPWMSSLVSFVSTLVFEQQLNLSLSIFLVIFLFNFCLLNQQNLTLQESYRKCLLELMTILLIMLAVKPVLPDAVLGIVLFNYILAMKSELPFLASIIWVESFLFPEILTQGWWLSAFFVCCFRKDNRLQQLFFAVISMLMMDNRIENGIVPALLFIIASLANHFKFFAGLDSVSSMEQDEPHQSLLEHQLFQFSRIFELIAAFFKQNHGSEVTFIEGMAKAIQSLSMQMKQSSGLFQDEAERLKKLLEGYHYQVRHIEISETMLGQKQIILQMDQCSRQDAKEVILPLLQMMGNRHLQLVQVQKRRGFAAGIQLEMSTIMPCRVHSEVFQKKKDPLQCGDTCSRYDCRQLCICTLSDGMGYGEEAHRISSFITELTQRLLSAQVPIESAIRSMNEFLRLKNQESFATLDVLIVDTLEHQAYLSKSGSCSTLLFRNHQILKLESNSLPLGIVEEIDADFYRFDCFDQDLFVLYSDGISESEVEKTLLNHSREILFEQFENQVAQLDAKDDVTVLLAEIHKR